MGMDNLMKISADRNSPRALVVGSCADYCQSVVSALKQSGAVLCGVVFDSAAALTMTKLIPIDFFALEGDPKKPEIASGLAKTMFEVSNVPSVIFFPVGCMPDPLPRPDRQGAVAAIGLGEERERIQGVIRCLA